MKNFLFLTLLNITFVVSPFLTTAPFFATTHAQALPPCSAIIPNDTNCIDFDGTVRPGTGGGEEEVSPSDNDEEINPGGGEEVVGSEKPAYCSSIDRGELESSIVPCGRKVHICYDEDNANCEFKHLFILVDNLARSFIFVVFAPLLTIMLMYIGFLFIKEQAAAKAKAKALLWRVLVGSFFVLASWLIVNFILDALNVSDEVKSGIKKDSN